MGDPEDDKKEEVTETVPPSTEEAKEADPKPIPQEELGVRPGHVPGTDEQPSAA